jgi:DNA-3-methyladenine glycosylase II
MRFELEASGPYSLAESARFAAHFSPTGHSIRGEREELELAFYPDGASEPAHLHVSQEGDRVVAEGDGDAAARDQLARILGLDVDATEWPEIGRRDPVVHGLQLRWPGFRPIAFPTAFEAGAWFVISQRTQFSQALRVKERLAEKLGADFGAVTAFPSPAAMVDLGPFPGLPKVKCERLSALARAAADGVLDGDRLRQLGPEDALEELKRLPGVGDFTAQGIVIRGANEPDWAALAEPRLAVAVERAYSLMAPPSPDEITEIAERWRPFRSWVTVMLRRTV